MTTSISRHLACLFLVLAGAPAIVVAGKAEDEAKAHVAKATRAHQSGNFQEARAELEAAYALDPKPDYLYALGQVHAKLGDCREATSYYRRFAALQKDPQVARVVDQAIEACKPASDGAPDEPSDRPPADGAPATSPAGSEAAPRTTGASPSAAAARPSPFGGTRQPPVAQRTPWYKDKLGDGLVLGGVVAGVIGLVQYRSAQSDLDEAEDRSSTTTLDRYEELVDGASGKRTTALVLAGAGGALIAAGVVRFVLVEGNTETRNLAIAPARGGGVVTFGGSF